MQDAEDARGLLAGSGGRHEALGPLARDGASTARRDRGGGALRAEAAVQRRPLGGYLRSAPAPLDLPVRSVPASAHLAQAICQRPAAAIASQYESSLRKRRCERGRAANADSKRPNSSVLAGNASIT